MWQRYLSLSNNSGVYAYLISDKQDSIEIVFKHKKLFAYIYSYQKPGQRHVERMIDLARLGRGLATYINTNIQENFVSKRRVELDL
jgi:hypothetical protein